MLHATHGPAASFSEKLLAVARARESEPLALLCFALFCFVVEQRVCQRAALQARFRSKTSFALSFALTLPCESTMRAPLSPFQPDIIMRL